MPRAADIIDPNSLQATQIIDLVPALTQLYDDVQGVDLASAETVEAKRALPDWCLTVADSRRLLEPILSRTRQENTRTAFRRAMWCVRHALNALKPTGATVQILQMSRGFAFQRNPRKRPFQTIPTNSLAMVLLHSLPPEVAAMLDAEDMSQWLTAKDDDGHVRRNVKMGEVLATAPFYQTRP